MCDTRKWLRAWLKVRDRGEIASRRSSARVHSLPPKFKYQHVVWKNPTKRIRKYSNDLRDAVYTRQHIHLRFTYTLIYCEVRKFKTKLSSLYESRHSFLWDSQVHETNTGCMEPRNRECSDTRIKSGAYIIACLFLTRYPYDLRSCVHKLLSNSIILSYVLNTVLPLDGRSTT